MQTSRRKFLRTAGVGAAAGAAMHWQLGQVAFGSAFEPVRAGTPADPIRLNNNENPYGPSAKVLDAVGRSLGVSNRYPCHEYASLADAIAQMHNVAREQVLLGCGSTEILRCATCAFLRPDSKLVQPWPTFEAIEEYAKPSGAQLMNVALTEEFTHDLEAMLAKGNGYPSLFYICNPNNPTGSLTTRADIERFLLKLPARSHVVIDEAYHHYVGNLPLYASFLDRPVEDERVLVVRTFSKVYGMAGLRLGYGVGSPRMIDQLRRHMTQDSINVLAIRAALAAIDDQEGVLRSVERNADDRQEFFNQAIARMLRPIDSHANFVMMNVHHPAEQVIEDFRKRHILIGRHFAPMDSYIRVSLGTPEEMRAFWREWDALPYAVMRH